MKIQARLQNTLGAIVDGAKENFYVAKNEITNVANEVAAAAKEEVEMQKAFINSYKERYATLKEKGFKKDEILNDVKGEATFLGNEVAAVFNRNVDKIKTIVSPKIEVIAGTAKSTGEKIANEIKLAKNTVEDKIEDIVDEVEDKVEDIVEEAEKA